MKNNYLVLARKYRPSRFFDLKGQDFLVTTLINAIKLNRVAHTFLFTGIRGSGKTTAARILAKTLNCSSCVVSDDTINPCEKCDNCKASFAEKHPDIIELDAASRTGVNDAREIIEDSNYLPILGKYKIFIIDEVHMLSNNAFNALLKTLEEPPEHVKFIFATTELRKIPITILSRCQKFELKRLSVDELAEHLAEILAKEAIEADFDALQFIASQAEGSVRDSLSLLDLLISNSNQAKISKEIVKNLFGFSNTAQLITLFTEIIAGNALKAIEIHKEFYYSGKDIIYIFQQLLELVNIISKLKLNAEINAYEYNKEDFDQINRLAEKCNIPSLTIMWQMILKGISELQISSNQLITGEMLIIRLCYLSNLPTPNALIDKINQPENKQKSNKSDSILSSLEPEKPKVVIQNFEELVQLFYQKKEMLLYQYLINDVSLIEFEPFKVKINHSKNVPYQFVNKVAQFLQEWTGSRWFISVAAETGSPTISDQASAAKLQQIKDLANHELIKGVLDSFASAEVTDIIKH